jgi:hypothetical protein
MLECMLNKSMTGSWNWSQCCKRQADDIRRRLDITDAVHGAVYQFSPVMGNTYWLVWDRRKQHTLLTPHGPDDWSSSAPRDYEYQAQVRYMGDHTWLEVAIDSWGSRPNK